MFPGLVFNTIAFVPVLSVAPTVNDAPSESRNFTGGTLRTFSATCDMAKNDMALLTDAVAAALAVIVCCT